MLLFLLINFSVPRYESFPACSSQDSSQRIIQVDPNEYEFTTITDIRNYIITAYIRKQMSSCSSQVGSERCGESGGP